MIALITGGTSGIGKCIAEEYLNRNYDVILVSRSEGQTEELKSNFPTRNISFIRHDLSNESECFALLEETKDMDIDIFVNNAGFGDIGRFKSTSLEKEIEMVKLNDIATLILVKEFLIRFTNKNKGKILVVCSAASFGVAPYINVYYSTKAFAYSLVHGYHRELRDMHSKVTISALCPGPVKTGFDKRANTKFNIRALTPEKVARDAVKGVEKGKLTIVPGALMKLSHFFSHFVPKRVISKVMRKQSQIKE